MSVKIDDSVNKSEKPHLLSIATFVVKHLVERNQLTLFNQSYCVLTCSINCIKICTHNLYNLGMKFVMSDFRDGLITQRPQKPVDQCNTHNSK